ncbi:MAG: preprotein translocase subunit SecA [Gammaproteobacteria bacterium]
MAANTMPRPGPAYGEYPENAAPKPGRFDLLVNRSIGRFGSRWQERTQQRDDIVARIEEAGASLENMPEEFLSMSVQGLRLRLARDGWSEELALQAFAMVREVSGRVLGMRHFTSQLLGGWVMFNGKVAEMQTGEGKTLTATLPASTAAMAGVPVHVITSNDYLATRDAQLMRPLYQALGLTVGVIEEGMDFEARRAAYASDITYCTNKQITFDYLRDRVARGAHTGKLHLQLERIYDDPQQRSQLMLRGLCFAIVDEADSVLVDEARTPLILSRTVEDDGEEHSDYRVAMHLADQLAPDEHFSVQPRERSVALREAGRQRLEELTESLGQQWSSARRREELVGQALTAQHVFIRDRDYVVRDDKVQIVDGNTGRTMPDRSWERGLHQMVEVKEGCEISGHKETLARMSYQRFFRRYLKLSGMTGTGREVAQEFSDVYGMSMVRIPTNKPSRRVMWRARVFVNQADKDRAIAASARKQCAQGRAVLIGTRTVESSERLAQSLRRGGLDPQVLNARQDADEAQIVEGAGQAGRLTVATNMAGRGTDIALADEVKASGGLHVIVAERNEASRIDRQLIGRCARQGDPGTYQMFASLEDDIAQQFYPAAVRKLMALFARRADGRLPRWLGVAALNLAQSALERRHANARAVLEKEDERLGDLLAFSGQKE